MDFSFKHKCDHERHHRPRSKILIKTLFDKRAEKAKAHEKMSDEILFQKGTSETESNETLSQVKQRNFIGRLVGRKRNQLGWTQDVFADKLQLAGWHDATRSTVSKVEDGSLRIDLLQLYCIATAFGLRPGDLLAEIDWRKQAEKMICSANIPNL